MLHQAQVAEQNCAQFDSPRSNSGLWLGLRDGRAGPAGPRQAHLRGLGSDRELRPLGRAADRRVDRQARQGHPARGRRAARARRRSTATTASSPTCATRTSRTRSWTPKVEALGRAGHPTITVPVAAARPTSAGSSSSPSSPRRWPAGCSASTRSTSRTCRRPRTTRRKHPRGRRPAGRGARATRRAARAGAAPPHYVAIMAFARAVRGVRRGRRRAARGASATRTKCHDHVRLRARATCTPPASSTRAGRRTACSSSFVHDGDEDVEIPEAGYGFRHLKNAQAIGDLQTLRAPRPAGGADPARGRRAAGRP